jgi:hypothetical protein
MAAGASALLILIGGGVAGVTALTGDDETEARIVTAVGQAAAAATPAEPGVPASQRPAARAPFDPADPAAPRTSDEADRTATRNPRGPAPRQQVAAPTATAAPASPPAAAPAQAASTTRTETETREIPFETRLVRDPQLPRGTRRIDAPGVPGEETLRYLVTVIDGQPIDRRLIDATVTRQPQHRVVAFGGRRHGRECGNALNFCVPLSRSAACPPPADGDPAAGDDDGYDEEPAPESITTGLELLGAGPLDGLELTC